MVSTPIYVDHCILLHRLDINDQSFNEFQKAFIEGKWVDRGVQAMTLLAWISFLDNLPATHLSVTIRNAISQELPNLKKFWADEFAADSKSYAFFSNFAKIIKRKAMDTDSSVSSGASFENDDVWKDFSSLAFQALHFLITNFIVGFKKMFRSILSRDQDAVASHEEQSQKGQGEQEPSVTSWEALLTLIDVIYRDRPDSAYIWWTNVDLCLFIRLASDVYTPRFLTKFIQVLSALSAGSNSALHAHNVMNSDGPGSLGNVNWNTFFRTLNSYVERLSQTDNSYELSPLETNLITAFLDLVAVVVKNCVGARRILCESQNFRALDTLFFLLVSRLQVELKASILNAISAFCSLPTEGFEVAGHIWSCLEFAQIIPTQQDSNVAGLTPGKLIDSRGLLYDLREIECSQKNYPETTAFLHLIKSLLVCSKFVGPQYVYDTLGVPNRVGGVRPYIAFIIEEIFLKLEERSYLDPTDKSEITWLCLEIFLLSLERFDITGALSYLGDQRPESLKTNPLFPMNNNAVNPLRALGLLPGFEILCRLLSGSKFAQKFFSIVLAKPDIVTEIDTQCTYTALRIIFFVLQIHGPFLGDIAPAIVDAKDAYFLQLPPSMTGLDSLLASKKNVIVLLGTFINSNNDLIALLSVNIISLLSKSAVFSATESSEPFHRNNRLASIFIGAQECDQIIQGFSDRLEFDTIEDSNATIDMLSGDLSRSESSAVHFEPSQLKHPVSHCIKLAILDLYIWNMSSKSFPNVAHFLLGIKLSLSKNSNDAFVSKVSSLPAIIDMVFKGELSNTSNAFEPTFYDSHPILAEKCYRLIYLLCHDHIIAANALRYLRNEHDFFWRQLAWFVPSDDGKLVSNGKDVTSMVARLHQCAWLLKALALEMQITAVTGQRSQGQRLLNMLFTSNGSESNNANPSNFEQPFTKASGILLKLNLSEISMKPIDLSQTLFSEIALADFAINDERGTEIFDLKTLYKSLLSLINQLDSSGTLMQSGGRSFAVQTLGEIMELSFEKNSAQQISSARFHCAQAWCTLIRISIKSYFDLFSSELRERRIFELLSTLLQRMGQDTSSLSIGSCVSQTILALIFRLKQDRQERSMIEAVEGKTTSQIGSFNSVIFQGILDGIQIPGSSPILRGNYFAALITLLNYMNLDCKDSSKAFLSKAEVFDMVSRLPNRFWELVCRDASEAELVWQTVAFSTLASLFRAANWNYAHSGNQTHPILNFLTKRNFLGHFISSIQNDDRFLQSYLAGTSDI